MRLLKGFPRIYSLCYLLYLGNPCFSLKIIRKNAFQGQLFYSKFLYIMFLFLNFCSFGFAGNLETFEEFHVQEKTYYKVKIREITENSIIIIHSKGISQISKNELSPELRNRLSVAANSNARVNVVASAPQSQDLSPSVGNFFRKQTDLSQKILTKFGSAPRLANKVDFRPQFNALGIGAKNQGFRPSCVVFSVIGALEYEESILRGHLCRYSEEYLIWATRKSLGLDNKKKRQDEDEGFNLVEVTQALKTYGVPLEEEMAYNPSGDNEIKQPSAEIIKKSSLTQNINPFMITGRSPEDQIDNIIHALNEGIPVVIGLRWPDTSPEVLAQVATLDDQSTNKGGYHAVLLVGYECKDHNKPSLHLIFRNSWGIQWGRSGYGFISFNYLCKNLNSAVFFCLQPK